MPSGGSSTHRSAPLVRSAEISKEYPSVRITLGPNYALLQYISLHWTQPCHASILSPHSFAPLGQWLGQRQYGSQGLCSRPRRGPVQASPFQSQHPPKTDDVGTQTASPLTSHRDNSEGHTSSRGVENPVAIALKVTFFSHPIVSSSLSYRCLF